MGHLGADRVLELARARFYWPHMQRDVESYISHKCRCVKQKVPTFQTRAPLQSITTTAPFQMVSLDFVHLEKSSGGYEYILVIMDYLTVTHKPMQLEISQLRQWRKSYMTTLFCISVFQKNSITTKEENLKITSSNNWKNVLVLHIQGLPRIIRKAMAKWNASIVPSLPCCEPYRKRKNHTGKTTSRKWYTPIIARVTSQQDSRHFISYLADTLVYLLI